MSKHPNVEGIYPLTPLQKGMLFHALQSPESAIYVEQLICELEGELDGELFAEVWRLLLARHTILRTAFVWKKQREPVQVVRREVELPWQNEDWRGVDAALQEERWVAFLEEDRHHGFVFNRAPLMRLATVRLGDDRWRFVWTHHHLLLDGWSLPLLMQELFTVYQARWEGRAVDLPRSRPFGDFVAWLRKRGDRGGEAFWQRTLADFDTPTVLDLDRPPTGKSKYLEEHLTLAATTTEGLRSLARRASVTLNTVVQGGLGLVLSRFSRRRDVLYGVVVAGRPAELEGSEAMVGPLINTVPLRLRLGAAERPVAWLQELQASQIEGREHEHTALADIKRWSAVAGEQDLFEALLAFENFPLGEALPSRLGGLEVRDVRLVERTNVPLNVIAIPGSTLHFKLGYDTARFDAATVQRFLAALTAALAGLTAEPGRLDEIALLPEAAVKELLAPPREAVPTPPATSLHGWFAYQAERTPSATALTVGEEQLTYGELAERARRLANHLLARGVERQDLVALLIERSTDLVVAILAILEAGAAYVPIDPSAPGERSRYVLDDCGARALITSSTLLDGLGVAEQLAVVVLDADRAAIEDENALAVVPAVAEQAAYVIYTSGSTGHPKGCVVTHGNVLRLFTSTEPWFAFSPRDVWTLFHSQAFDFSVWELWGALLYGGRLVVVPQATSRDPEAFHALLAAQGVTVLNQTPSAFRLLTAADADRPPLAELRLIIFGGEALEPTALAPWVERYGDERPLLVNMYGITETTVHVTYRPIRGADVARGRGSVIGGALPDLLLTARDRDGQLAVVGVPGELHVAGAGLSRGYLNRPRLTAERFPPDRFASRSGERVYRTGDLARRRPDGDFEYLGRIDEQVQVRGFRVELGEIEAASRRHPEVGEAVVLAHQDAPEAMRLVAYVVARAEDDGGDLSVEELRAFLSAWLPDYMIPAAFVWLTALPLTSNGKVDRKALLRHGNDAARLRIDSEHVAPRSAEERALAAIWEKVLQVSGVGIHDNYFAMGGDSIRSIGIVSLAREEGLVFDLADLLAHQTIAELLAHLGGEAPTVATALVGPFELIAPEDRELLPVDIEDAYPLARLQAGMLFHSGFSDESSAYVDVFSYHLQAPFAAAAFRRALKRLSSRHPVLRTSFDLSRYTQALQLVHREVEIPLAISDLRRSSVAEQEAVIDAWIEAERKAGFDDWRAPLMRLHVHRRGDDTFQLGLTVHHAILDGWSLATLLAELVQEYLHDLGQSVAPPTAAPPAFRQFVALEREILADPEARSFWREQVADADLSRLPRRGKGGERRIVQRQVRVSAATSARLARLADELEVGIKSLLLAAHLRVLSVVCGSREVMTGLVANGRPEMQEGERATGLFLNTLPFRSALRGGSWRQLARATFEHELELLPRRRFPLAAIQKLAGGQPLFETDFNYVHLHVLRQPKGSAGDLAGVAVLASRTVEETNFVLTANFSKALDGDEISGLLIADAAELGATQLVELAAFYERALIQLADEPEAPYLRCSLLSSSQERQLLVEWGRPDANSWAAALIHPPFIHRAVAEQAMRTPDAVAVLDDGDRQLTYDELTARGLRLAARLQADGVGPDRVVGVMLERSSELVLAFLAVLEAGGAYLPLDPDYPAERIAFMVRDSGIELVLTDGAALPLGHGVDQIALGGLELEKSSDSPVQARPEGMVEPGLAAANLAYILYTSGSTGRPKGAQISHGAIANHMVWMGRAFPLTATDRVLQKTPFSFDASVWEFWAPLMSGALLVMAKPGGHQDLAYLAVAVERLGITVLQVVPTLLRLLLERPELAPGSPLRRLYCGGEALDGELLRRVHDRLPDGQLINLYGVTEAAIDSITWTPKEETGAEETSGTVPIGRPITGVAALILDPSLLPVPIATAGELFLGGAGLGRGYLGRPALTAERFVPDPHAEGPGERLYRTGDLARFRADGAIEYLDRGDRQVKLRGYRIELGEIEAVLASHPVVTHAAVLVKDEESGPRLVAFAVARDGAEPPDARSFLKARLPEHMVPSAFLWLDALPRSSSGKLDRRALLAHDVSAAAVHREWVAPHTDTERILCEVWQQVLGVERVGIEDNFFELGGDSILSLQAVSRCVAQGLELTPKLIFEAQTVAAVAARVTRRRGEAGARRSEAEGPVPLLPIQRHFLARDIPRPEHWNQALLLSVPNDFSFAALTVAVAHLARHHDALRLRFSRHDEDGWRQRYGSLDGSAVAERTDLSGLVDDERSAALTLIAEADQGGLDLEQGPVLRARYFDFGAAEKGRLLLIAHHLVVDGVSWRILLEDLAMAYDAARHDETLHLAPVTASVRDWAEALATFSDSDELRRELDVWLAQGDSTLLPIDFSDGRDRNREATAEIVTVSLGGDETQALLRQVPAAYHTRIDEVLLTPLVATLAEWSGAEALTVDLEGHGREEILTELDLSRTVGWLTSLFPVTLPWSGSGEDPGAALKIVKERLRTVPRRGLGYGVLRYLAQDPTVAARLAALPQAEIAFNYLGRFDAGLADNPLFGRAEEAIGADHDPQAPRQHLLEVVALVADRGLEVQWIYSDRVHQRTTIERLAERYLVHLRELIAHCREPGAGGFTPSDFPLAALDQKTLDELVGKHREVTDLYPLSPLQEGLLFHAMAEPEGGLYVQQVTATVSGELAPAALEAAWQAVIDRHAALRSAFHWGELRRPLQIVVAGVRCDFTWLDWRSVDLAEQEKRWREHLAADRQRGFDYRTPPLMRLAAMRFGERSWRLLWSHHHLLLDGWSLPLIFGQVLEGYRDTQENDQPAPRPYRDFIAWLQHRDRAVEERYWRSVMADVSEPTSLPPLGPVTDAAASHGEATLVLDEAASSDLVAFARRHRLTLNTVLQGTWALLLSRVCGEDEVVFGVTVSGRGIDLPGVEAMVGMFINTLPLRVTVGPRLAVRSFLEEVQARQIELGRHEHSRLVDVQGWSGIPRGQALFESIVVFENYPLEDSMAVDDRAAGGRAAGGGRAPDGAGGLEIHQVNVLERTNFPLALYILPGREIRLSLSFRADRFPSAVMGRLLEQARRLLAAMTIDVEAPLSALELVSEEEKRQLLQGWQEPSVGEGAMASELAAESPFVHRLVARRAVEEPSAVAVVSGEERLTYGELVTLAASLTGHLQSLGVERGDRVGICLGRSSEMMVALLAVMASGAAYVPLDPRFPRQRLAIMLADSAASVVITTSELTPLLPETTARWVCLDADAPEVVAPREVELDGEDLAYIIFTSGSTGRPKGVQVGHGALSNLLFSFAARPGFARKDALLAMTTLSFDIAALELYLPLIRGGRLVIADRDTAQDADRLAAVLSAEACRVMQATPATWRLLLTSGWQPREGLVMWCGGEALPEDLARELLAGGGELWNVYGPTETTIWSLIQPVERPSDAMAIGRPVARTRIFVVDRFMNPQPVGLPGELLIGGAGLARGYWRQAAMTALRFIPDPFPGAAAGRLYRTGDRVRFTDDGRVVFLGRLDAQIKIRGFRVELGEIEAALATAPAVAQAAVVLRPGPSGQGQLVAYFVAEPSFVPPGEASDAEAELVADLRHHLRARLPEYMLPHHLLRLDALPLTPNLKIDRKALPALMAMGLGASWVAPRNAVEEVVASVWQDVLELPRIGAEDDFFELGGHSLLAAQALTKIRRIFGADLPLTGLFQATTVAKLATALIDIESQPGRMEKIATLLLEIRRMTPEEREAMRQKKRRRTVGAAPS